MYKKQIAVVVVVVAIMGYLYMLPVKGLIKPKAAAGHTSTVEAKPRTITNVSVEVVSSAGKMVIGPALSAQVTILEGQLKNVGEAAKLDLQKELAKKWDDVNQPAPAAFYYQDVARAENTFGDWLAAGNHFNDAYKFTQDTLVQPFFVVNAIADFKNAVKLKPNDLDAKTGLGVAFVNQTSLGMTDADGGSPMQGIMLLLDVVKQDPKNWNANLSLGVFAMKSGQFQKAAQRFKTIIEIRPNELEPYYYLAESYKQLGMKNEAITAYEKCKQMNPDPEFTKVVDGYINELKK
jgi:tetratricopeptide (TPR) repeat protein